MPFARGGFATGVSRTFAATASSFIVTRTMTGRIFH